MRFSFALAGLNIAFEVCEKFLLSQTLLSYTNSQAPALDDIAIRFNPFEPSLPPLKRSIGSDGRFAYYEDEKNALLAVRSNGPSAISSITRIPEDYRGIDCFLDYYESDITWWDSTLLLNVPIVFLLLRQGVGLLHASRVVIDGRAILFSAPSGTGKTTQATLWQDERGAQIVSADRVALRYENNTLMSYSFPMDGSAPKRENVNCPVAAIVALEQGLTDEVFKLTPQEAFRAVLSQSALFMYDRLCTENAAMLASRIACESLCLRLSCTKTANAVNVLHEALLKSGAL